MLFVTFHQKIGNVEIKQGKFQHSVRDAAFDSLDGVSFGASLFFVVDEPESLLDVPD